MLRVLVLAAAVVLAAPGIVHAQSSATPEQIADTFFGNLKKGQTTLAFRELWGGTLMEKKPADVEFAAKQTEVALQSFGKVADWELISEQLHSPSYKVRLYLLRLEGAPLFFKLAFYRRPTGWMVYRLDFNDTLARLP